MKYEPDRFQAKPGESPPITPDVYLSYAPKVEMRNAHLPGKGWLIWGYFLVFCSAVTIPTGGFLLCGPFAAILLWHYYSRHASYKKAKDLIPYSPRSAS